MLTSIILAAGKGTRMKSDKPKVLHEILGIPMINYVLDVVKEVNSFKNVVVVGHGKDEVIKSLENSDVEFAVQSELLGTAHAVMMAENFLNDGEVLVLCGDTPLLEGKTVKRFIEFHKENSMDCSVITAKFDNPYGYGRIVRGKDGKILKIVEEKDSTNEEKKINEINSGIYLINAKLLKESFKEFNNNNNQNEYYLTDVIDIFNTKGYNVGGYLIENNDEIFGVNSKKQLNYANEVLRKRILDFHMDNGVTIENMHTISIEKDVEIDRDTVIFSGSYISKGSKIGRNSSIGPDAKIYNSIIKDNVSVKSSTIIDSEVGNSSNIGPYAYLRPNSIIGENVKIGDFVEVKNSIIGNNSKVSHLSYIGDGEVGHNVNVGCGVVFVNYNGRDKNKTIIKDNAFVGCNVNLIAPVTVEENSYVAAGSTITKTVPENSLSIARAKQVNKEGWVSRRGLLKTKK